VEQLTLLREVAATYPGGSRQRVNRAGDSVRAKAATEEDLAVIEEWRAAHRPVLNTFQAILRNRTRGQNIIVAQRHKRRRTIFGKLERFPGMQLSRMDDVAGCRLIFSDIASLYEFRTDLHDARFNHKLKSGNDKYDYIRRPKGTGYRGVHDIYEYDVRSLEGEKYKGLLIELQYRTIYQHAWATCVEVVGS
jgi:putative GTP pyrophosphokinase